jgi:hypothetical protein
MTATLNEKGRDAAAKKPRPEHERGPELSDVDLHGLWDVRAYNVNADRDGGMTEKKLRPCGGWGDSDSNAKER